MNTTDIRLTLIVDAQNRIKQINQDYLQWLGYELDEVIDQPVSLIRPNHSPESLQHTIVAHLNKNVPIQSPIQEVKKNGETYWSDMVIQPIFNRNSYAGYTSIKRIVQEPQKIAEYEKLFADIRTGRQVYTNGGWVSANKHKWMTRLGMQRASMLKKTLMTAAAISLAVISISAVFTWQNIQQIDHESIDLRSNELQILFSDRLLKKQEIGQTNAIGISFTDEIGELAANRDQAGLMSILKNIQSTYAQNSNFKGVKLEFVDENGVSYLKTWKPLSEQKLENLSKIDYVQSMLKKPAAINVNGVGEIGFHIKSLVPIYHAGKFEGFIEFIQGVGSIRRDFATSNQAYLPAISTDYLANASESAQSMRNNIAVSNDGKWVVGNDKHFGGEQSLAQIAALKKIDLNQLFKDYYYISDTAFNVASPIMSRSGKVMGYNIISEPIASYQSFVQSHEATAIQNFAYLIFTTLLISGLMMLLMWGMVLRPVRKVINTINDATENTDLFVRVHHYPKDEIGMLGSAYNRQAMQVQTIISEANFAMEGLSNGHLDHRIEQPFKSDYKMLQNNINQTSDVIEQTFTHLSEIITAMHQGNFHLDDKHNLSGAYARIADQGYHSLQDLAQVFSEINQVMSLAARGKLDERITHLHHGDIKQLQESINQSLELIEQGFSEVIAASQRMSQGDFSRPTEGNYEYSLKTAINAINTSMEHLTETMYNLQGSANEVFENTYVVFEGSQNLNTRTQTQAASLEQTSATMEQTMVQIRNNLENAITATKLSEEQMQKLGIANTVMEEAKHSIHEILAASDKISEITAVINSIAFQTNLLALNAAVEAARAGEHGRGFAVVAQEVRSLAGKSADAAKDIERLIQDASDAVHKGVAHVENVAESLNDVTYTTERMKEMISDVANASQEQADGVEEVNKAIAHIDGITQQNAALVEETNASTEHLQASANDMKEIISGFTLKRLA